MNWNLARKAERLATRAAVIQKTRTFFIDRGYLEVDTPCLIPAPAPEAHIEAITAGSLYLQTSPELCMKRLLAAGYPRLFQICHCWRDKERGSRHLPEFTMLEWYRSNADYRDLMTEAVELLTHIASAYCCPQGYLVINNARIAMNGKFERITVRDAFRLFTETSMDKALEDGDFDRLMTECIEPYLGLKQPTIIYDYPAKRAALARIKAEDPAVAERFELYIAGMELANAFSELNDEQVQRQRFIAEQQQRSERNSPACPMPEPFLAEIGSMPPAAGIALGIDRLIMLLTGAESIDDVVAFTPEDL